MTDHMRRKIIVVGNLLILKESMQVSMDHDRVLDHAFTFCKKNTPKGKLS